MGARGSDGGDGKALCVVDRVGCVSMDISRMTPRVFAGSFGIVAVIAAVRE
jgi:hypothetical protein